MKKHIFLIGFMGCGKSTNAAVLAALTDRRQIEMDEEIAAGQGMPVQEIFKNYGEAFFRDLETELVRNLKDREPAVVSCGGGVVLREENVRLMKESGSIVLLTANPETVYERIRETGDRPVLKGHMNVPDIRQLMEKRRPYYEAAADFSVATDGKTSEEICREIVRRLDLDY